uniref:Histone-lysine N-methyltransferase, H3 lysine-79 specific n=1 Tax=Macrostomum lignano TaxID=282301 RepID=A0A1I8HVL6_9PLAT
PDDGGEDGSEALDTLRLILSELPLLAEDTDVAAALRQADPRRFVTLQRLCDAYNRRLRALRSTLDPEEFNKLVPRRASVPHLKHIDPDVLNRYEAFSPEVYGETSFELINHMLEHVKFSPDDTFIDLGSGVGQVVVQVAAATQVKRCIGIEKADIPARYAAELSVQFKRWMAFFGKEYQPFELRHDDFLADNYRELIANCTVIFVNNFAFGPRVDHDLKERFAQLKEGARIVSSKVFCPLNFRITDRNLSDIGSILTVEELDPLESAVSWTNTPFSYYLHVVDYKQLEHYFASLKNPELKKQQAAATGAVRRDRRGRPIDLARSTSSAALCTSRQNSSGNSNGGTNGNQQQELAGSSAPPDNGIVSSAPASIAGAGGGSRHHHGNNGGAASSSSSNGGGSRASAAAGRRRAKAVRRRRQAGLSLLHASTLASHSRPVPQANAPSLSGFADGYTTSRHCREFAGLDAVRSCSDLRETAYSLERHADTLVQPPGMDRLLAAMGTVMTAWLRQTARPDFRQELLNRVKAERERRRRLRIGSETGGRPGSRGDRRAQSAPARARHRDGPASELFQRLPTHPAREQRAEGAPGPAPRRARPAGAGRLRRQRRRCIHPARLAPDPDDSERPDPLTDPAELRFNQQLVGRPGRQQQWLFGHSGSAHRLGSRRVQQAGCQIGVRPVHVAAEAGLARRPAVAAVQN